MPATTSPDIDSIARRLAVLLSELAGPQPVVPPDLPEYIQDPDTCTWIAENGDIEHWERGPRTFAFVAPERTHDLLQVGRDIAADLHRRLGDDDAPVHCVVHRHQGRDHLHIAVDGMAPVYKLERAVDAALERRQERDRARVLEVDQARDRDRDRGPRGR